MFEREKTHKWIFVFLLLVTINNFALGSRVIYVDDDANGVNDGSSWQNAYIYLQDALTDARNSEQPVMSLSNVPIEIRVAQGTYKPDQGLIIDHPHWASFNLINNVAMKGGYAGVNEFDPNERNLGLYESILSGDLDSNDIEVDDPYDLKHGIMGIRGRNSITILYSNENDASAVLDGFTIKGGCNWGSPSLGGGMRIYKGNPTIMNCTFTGNAAYEYGGGICIDHHSYTIKNPMIINCTFTKNYANHGGGIFNAAFKGLASFENPTFESLPIGDPNIINCVFSNNYATYNGGGLSVSVNTVMSNCLFTGNYSEHLGGGLSSSGDVELNNCTFYGNWAQDDSAIYKSNSSIMNISNSIIWNGHDAISDINSSTLTISYSDIQGDWEGIGNIDIDPLFENPGYWADVNDPNLVLEPNEPDAIWIEGDYHLMSEAGRYDPNSQTWMQDDITSPCIDAGDPNIPIGLEPFPNGARINMGAYGTTNQASKSLSNKISFRDYWPFEVGYRWWNAYIISDAGIDLEINDKLIINDFDTWKFDYTYTTISGLKYKKYYRVYTDGALYKTTDINDLNSLPEIRGHMQLEYPEIICPNEPVSNGLDLNIVAFQGTLEEVLELSQTNPSIREHWRHTADDFQAGNHANVLGFAAISDRGTSLLELYGYHFGPMLQDIYIMDGTVDIETFVRITKPTANDNIQSNVPIEIVAEVVRSTSPVIKMEFFHYKSYLLGTDTDGSDGWSILWNNPSKEAYLRVRATTENGMIVSSKFVNLE